MWPWPVAWTCSQRLVCIKIILNRPGEAGAVLQTHTFLIDYITQPFPPNLQNIMTHNPWEREIQLWASWEGEKLPPSHLPAGNPNPYCCFSIMDSSTPSTPAPAISSLSTALVTSPVITEATSVTTSKQPYTETMTSSFTLPGTSMSSSTKSNTSDLSCNLCDFIAASSNGLNILKRRKHENIP